MALVADGVLDEDLAVSVTRAMGHNAARLVEWQVDALVEHLGLTRGLTQEEATRAAVELSAEHLDDLQSLLVFVWRRQLAAVAGRALGTAEGSVSGVLAVGFADLVSYTRLSQRMEERELAALVDRFDALSADVIAGAGGRLVKTVGDEVLFVADRAETAARIGLELAEAMAADPDLPDVRVGIRDGDGADPDGRRLRPDRQPGQPADGARAARHGARRPAHGRCRRARRRVRPRCRAHPGRAGHGPGPARRGTAAVALASAG
jgi:adenylate cyclase